MAVSGTVGIASASGSHVSGQVSPLVPLMQNGGFEGTISQGSCCPTSVGNWNAVSQTGSSPPARQSTYKHNGLYGLLAQSNGGLNVSSFAYQDFTQFQAGVDHTLSAWAYPAAGHQTLALYVDWDRGAHGAASAITRLDIYPDHVEVTAWRNTVVFFPSDYYGAWHEFKLNLDASTHRATLKVDGIFVGRTPPGLAYDPAGLATVWVGQGKSEEAASKFGWDDVKFMQ